MDYEPMLCQKLSEDKIKEWFNLDSRYYKAEYKANIKYDGERIIAIVKDGKAELMNRRGNNKTEFFPEVVKAIEEYTEKYCLIKSFILDGEVITYEDDFHKLQRRSKTKDTFKRKLLEKEIPVKYMVFDILESDNINLMNKPLKERLLWLPKFQQLVNSVERVEYGEIKEMYEQAIKEDREGIIIKEMKSPYENGKRSWNWLKCKFFKEMILEVITYTENNAGIRVEDNEGNVVQVSGTQHKEVKDKIDTNGKLKIEVQYLEKTEKGRLRNPSFRGIAK